jgi:hypothetical protein
MAQHDALVRKYLDSAGHVPLCIPIAWTADGSYWLAYHHGWSDARFYNVVEIRIGGPHSAFAGYIATVDDFGHLVPILHRPCVVRGELELH